ncbi:MAG: glycoside hydrolase family 16 protein [Ignavibacteriales bacterium]|nr:glycoside hydrolase family 16 protein [Ignavibacteriales bacterium]
MINVITFMLFFYLSSGPGCKKIEDAAITDPPVSQDSIPTIPGWKLVWNDEFTGTTVDPNKWEYEVNGDGGGNNELQYYTARKENSYIDTGKLVIEAREENYLGKKYTSARMRTQWRGEWTYGRFEVRAKLPCGQGIWPAIWMLPTDWEYGGWPLSGEIDIMEMLGHEIDRVYGTIHFGPAWPNNQKSGGSYKLSGGNFCEDFHTFAVVWDSTGFQWFVDGVKYFSTAKGKPFDKRFHLLLNVAVGGNWPGNPNASTSFPQRMVVEYVRVYEKTE